MKKTWILALVVLVVVIVLAGMAAGTLIYRAVQAQAAQQPAEPPTALRDLHRLVNRLYSADGEISLCRPQDGRQLTLYYPLKHLDQADALYLENRAAEMADILKMHYAEIGQCHTVRIVYVQTDYLWIFPIHRYRTYFFPVEPEYQDPFLPNWEQEAG